MIDLSEKGQQYIRQGFEEFAVAYDLHFYHYRKNSYIIHYMHYYIDIDVVTEYYMMLDTSVPKFETGRGMDKLLERISFEF